MNVYGSLDLSGVDVMSYSGNIYFQYAGGGATFTPPTPTISGSIYLAGGGTINQAGTLTLGGTLFVESGTWDITSGNLTISDTLLVGSGATIDLGAATVSTVGLTLYPGCTVIGGTSSLTVSMSAEFELHGSLTFYNLTISSTSTNAVTFIAACTFNDLTINRRGSIRFGADQDIDGTFTLAGTPDQRPVVRSTTVGTARTINAAAVSFTDVIFEDITRGVGAAFTGTRIGDLGGNTGITFSSTTRYANSGGGRIYWHSSTTWANSSGGATSLDNIPLPQDDIVIEGSTEVYAALTDTSGAFDVYANDVSGTGVAGIPIGSTFYVMGNIDSNATIGQGGIVAFVGRTTQTISTTQTQHVTLYIDSYGGTVSLGANLTIISYTGEPGIDIVRGTFDANDFDVTFNHRTLLGSGVRAQSSATSALLMGSGTWTFQESNYVSGNVNHTIWLTAGIGFTLDSESSTIIVEINADSNATVEGNFLFNGGGHLYNHLTAKFGAYVGGPLGTRHLIEIQGSNTFGTLEIDHNGQPNHPFTFRFGDSQTQKIIYLVAEGTTTHKVGLQSTSSVTAATLQKIGGGRIVVDYCDINDLTVTPSGKFYATNSTDGGNNSGWTFGSPPTTGRANFLPFF